MAGSFYEPVEVSCFSGFTYADRPRTFVWQGETVAVVAVRRAWLAPDGRYFCVASGDGSVFVLRYDAVADRWYARAT